ncbi:MAG: HAD-IC family P-type ATPase [Candidatus Sungbacteria bacterium]|nr:HAD-IC family P-type ATPase [Candidatus Sungbacteria bacterium]
MIRPETVNAPFWGMTSAETLAAFEASREGITEEEAQKRRVLFEGNTIEERRRASAAALFIRQLTNPLLVVLIIAGSMTVALGNWVEAGVIFAAVLIQSVMGLYQEQRAETALASLASYVRTRARVQRAGREREIDAAELVPGDVIRVSQGDRIPADGRILFANNLEVDESILTGESALVAKKEQPVDVGTPLAERSSMAFSGTLAAQGFADVVVTSTGSLTEFGKIASLVAARERTQTPLQRSLGRFTRRMGAVLAAFIVLLFLLGSAKGFGLFDMFLISVAVGVSAVPEGLPIALTVILAVGVERLSRRKGVVRRLLAAETLGSATLILTDKTGTLTQAQMELVSVLPSRPGGSDAELLRRILGVFDVVVENPEDSADAWRMVGRPIEVAAVRGAGRRGVLLPRVSKEIEVLDRLPFSSAYKFSGAVIADSKKERAEIVLLGAPEIVLEYTKSPPEEKRTILDAVERRAHAGERILACAWREVERTWRISDKRQFSGLVFEGLLAFRDPLRPGVPDAVRRIEQAGVKTVIVTGDHKGTAEAVAREIGMVDGKGAVLTGQDMVYLDYDQWRARSDQVRVYARVTPEQKLTLTQWYQKKGEIVAVTGDGVNDAPALQAADIGVAVGSGTDVAKGAADLVLLDDNFETLVSAVEEGRKILDNIRKVIVYLLSDAADELLLIGGALVAGIPLPLSALQILFVNMFSDSIPAVAFAFEQGVDGLGRKPRRLHRALFDSEMRFLILVIGVLTSAFLFVLYVLLRGAGFPQDLVRTFIFASFATYTLFLAPALRSLEKSIFSYNPFSNRVMLSGVIIGIALTSAVVYVPILQRLFQTVSLPPLWAFWVLGVGIVNIGAIEIGKWLFRSRILR